LFLTVVSISLTAVGLEEGEAEGMLVGACVQCIMRMRINVIRFIILYKKVIARDSLHCVLAFVGNEEGGVEGSVLGPTEGTSVGEGLHTSNCTFSQ